MSIVFVAICVIVGGWQLGTLVGEVLRCLIISFRSTRREARKDGDSFVQGGYTGDSVSNDIPPVDYAASFLPKEIVDQFGSCDLSQLGTPPTDSVGTPRPSISVPMPSVKPIKPEAPTPEGQIEALTEAFLRWPLPKSVCADLCATMPNYEGRVGTNLLSHSEAKQMFTELVLPLLSKQGAEVKKEAQS